MLPDPAAVQLPPPAPTQVHVQARTAGNVSVMLTPVAAFGPALEPVIVYVTDPPGVAVVTPSVLVTEGSAGQPSVQPLSSSRVPAPTGRVSARSPTLNDPAC